MTDSSISIYCIIISQRADVGGGEPKLLISIHLDF